MKKITSEWIEKAEGDYRVAKRESLPEDAVYDIVCFHSHQCIEKYLKAALVENNVEFEKIHDLELLMNRCKEFMPLLENNRENFIWLTQFSVRVRYPGFEATKNDAKKALSITTKLRKIVRNFFKLSVD